MLGAVSGLPKLHRETKRGRKDIQHDFYYFDSVFMSVVCEIVGS